MLASTRTRALFRSTSIAPIAAPCMPSVATAHDMILVRLGRRSEDPVLLEHAADLIAVRTFSGKSIQNEASGMRALGDGQRILELRDAGVEVVRILAWPGGESIESRLALLREHEDVRFAGRVLQFPTSRVPVLYTENFFVKFHDVTGEDRQRALLSRYRMSVKLRLPFAGNSYWTTIGSGVGQEVFDVAGTLLEEEEVEFCHPELVWPKSSQRIFPEQWCLARNAVGSVLVDASANVADAHAVARGEGITIAVIDDGFDLRHEEFASEGKIRSPRDLMRDHDDPGPKTSSERHGTWCAGIACANGQHRMSGVAPAAMLMPLRVDSAGAGSMKEALAFDWAARNGADVISCSWTSLNGKWNDPNDVVHRQRYVLQAHTRLAIEFAMQWGRDGKGCVVVFAAGNGNESADNDGYPSLPGVVAVAACNAQGRRSAYSDKGTCLSCAFPSDDPTLTIGAESPGVWTTDLVPRGVHEESVEHRGYTGKFGGTSASCAGVAGVAALVLSVNPGLRSEDVRTVLSRSCDVIDADSATYDAGGHSTWYGFGRLNAARAVQLAKHFGGPS